MIAALSLSHCATALVAVSAQQAFDFLADPLALGNWSLGCMHTEPAGTARVFKGRSMFNGADSWVAVDAHAATLTIDYRTGSSPDRLISRICARVVPAENCGLPAGHCYVTLLAWRPSDMSEARWLQLCAAHEAEIWLIKAQLESDPRPRGS